MTKNLLIIASDFQNMSTGGLIWINKLAKYAKGIYKKTKLVDLTKTHRFARSSRLFGILYYSLFFLQKNKFFAFIDHSLHLRLGLPLFMSFFLRQNSYAVICHHIFYKLRKNRVLKNVEYLSEKIFLKIARIIIVPSRQTQQDIEKLHVSTQKIYIINPTLAVRCDTIPQRTFQNRILFVGNVEPRKGVDVLIKALSLIERIDFSADIVGGSHKQLKYFSTLRKLVSKYNLSNKIFFHGRVSSEKVIDFYRSANIFVFPSRHEGYGMVLLEAMGFGLPIVATDIPTTRNLIKDNVNGYLCPVDDVICMSQSIKKLLDDHCLQVEIGKKNYEASRKFRSWDEVAQQTFITLRPYLDLK